MSNNGKTRENLVDRIGGKTCLILMVIFTVFVIGGGIVCTEIEIARKRDAAWIGSYPMANQNITWSYARIGGGK